MINQSGICFDPNVNFCFAFDLFTRWTFGAIIQGCEVKMKLWTLHPSRHRFILTPTIRGIICAFVSPLIETLSCFLSNSILFCFRPARTDQIGYMFIMDSILLHYEENILIWYSWLWLDNLECVICWGKFFRHLVPDGRKHSNSIWFFFNAYIHPITHTI